MFFVKKIYYTLRKIANKKVLNIKIGSNYKDLFSHKNITTIINVLFLFLINEVQNNTIRA